MANFQYESISGNNDADTIRIIELHPGYPIDLISCHLKSVHLCDEPRYEALSYCWGDPTATKMIVCNGKNLSVIKNLHEALHQLRCSSGVRTLWADAICINQKDVDERNQQVHLMRQVYEIAEQVVIWLGPEDDCSQLGMALIPKIVEADKKREATGDRRAYTSLRNRGLRDVYGLPMRSDKAWRGFFAILQRPWFGRGWVIQEVAVASSIIVCCGRNIVSFDELHLALLFAIDVGLDGEYLSPSQGRLIYVFLTRHAFKVDATLDLLSLLLRHRMALTTDPRDKVFALCGLAADADQSHLNISIDYRRPVQEAFREVAVRMLTKNRNFDIFSVPSENENPRNPSWVPDFTSPIATASRIRCVESRIERVNHCSFIDRRTLYADAKYSIHKHTNSFRGPAVRMKHRC